MKYLHKSLIVLGALVIGIMTTACSTTVGYIGHGIQTEVHLSQANFDVIKSVTGEAQADYYFGIGPTNQNLLYQAKQDMSAKAGLKGSQAFINVTTDITRKWFFFWREKKVVMSAEVVQFKIITPKNPIKTWK